MKLKVIAAAGVFLFSSGTLQAADLSAVFKPLPAQPPIPANNPQTAEKIELGKQLFFDPRLSITGTHSCNSCHNLSGSGADGRTLPIGVYGRQGERHTLTLWNAAFHTVNNWDGSAKTLEEQAREHILDPKIMGMPDAHTLVSRIEDIPGYQTQFRKVFPRRGVTLATIAKALSSFERTLVTPDSAFDKYLRGDKKALSESAKRGFNTFVNVRCAACHFWVNLAGPIPGLALQQGEGFYELFPNYPGSDYEKRYGFADDLGRYHFSQDETDRRMWRMPSLRNIAITAPYFHNGAIKTLDQAIRVMAKTQLKRTLTEQQINDIVAFLNAQTGNFPEITLPRLPQTPARTSLAGHDH